MHLTRPAMDYRSSKTIKRTFRLFLRILGSVSLLALIFVAAPYSWMDEIHRILGMGPLPDQPVVGYLARSTSAFYAIFGGLLWMLSFDPERYYAVLNYLGGTFLLFGASLFVIDWVEGMPFFWKVVEGPTVILFGFLLVLLNRAIGKKSLGRASPTSVRY